jgi:hypothetical protein
MQIVKWFSFSWIEVVVVFIDEASFLRHRGHLSQAECARYGRQNLWRETLQIRGAPLLPFLIEKNRSL